MTMIEKEWSERVRAAAAAKTPLCLHGGGTKDFYGRAPAGEAFDLRANSGIVAYEPTELVVTVRGGTPLGELEAALAEKGQYLAFEPPHFGAGATVAGCVASGLSGPRRASMGAVRDFMLGVKLLDGRGEVLRFGGQVMKNVAGYDVSRLVAGSLGTLGILLEASIKVLPRPVAETTLRFELDEATALRHLNAWGGQPLPVSASRGPRACSTCACRARRPRSGPRRKGSAAIGSMMLPLRQCGPTCASSARQPSHARRVSGYGGCPCRVRRRRWRRAGVR